MRAPLFTFKQKKERKNKNNLFHVLIKILLGCQIFRRIRRIEKHIPNCVVERMSQQKTDRLYICGLSIESLSCRGKRTQPKRLDGASVRDPSNRLGINQSHSQASMEWRGTDEGNVVGKAKTGGRKDFHSAKPRNKNRRRRMPDLFIYSISFNVIQPMWLCRQIPKHKIADMSKRRNQANKTKQHT
jgi:hypothetical protein